MKEEFFDLIVESYYNSYQLGDFGDIVTEATGAYYM